MKHLVPFALLALCACSKDRPKLTPDKMPPSLASLALKKTTEAEILAAYPHATVTDMQMNDYKSHEIKVESPRMTLLTTPRTKDGVLFRISLHEDNICEWVKKTVASDKGSTNCPGNRKTGDSSGKGYYCMDTPGGDVIAIECYDKDPPGIDELDLFVP